MSSWYVDARESLLDDLFEKLGRDPTPEEEDEYACEERILDRIAYLREDARGESA